MILSGYQPSIFKPIPEDKKGNHPENCRINVLGFSFEAQKNVKISISGEVKSVNSGQLIIFTFRYLHYEKLN